MHNAAIVIRHIFGINEFSAEFEKIIKKVGNDIVVKDVEVFVPVRPGLLVPKS